MRFFKVLSVLVLVALLVVIGSLFSLHKKVWKVLEQVTSIYTSSTEPKIVEPEQRKANQDHVVIFLVKSTPTHFFLVPINRQVDGPVDPSLALETLLRGPLEQEELFAPVPQSTKLLGLSIYDGLAVANFSGEIISDFQGGSLLESYLVESIVNTLTEFPSIDRVQILVEGEPVESLGGHVLISGPLGRKE